MSWLFGKKKQRDSVSEKREETSGGQSDGDYVILEKDSASSVVSGPGLYPYLGEQGRYPPPISRTESSGPGAGESQGYLGGVPFEYGKSLSNDLELEKLKMDEIASRLERSRNEDYEYEFSVERSVMNETE